MHNVIISKALEAAKIIRNTMKSIERLPDMPQELQLLVHTFNETLNLHPVIKGEKKKKKTGHAAKYLSESSSHVLHPLSSDTASLDVIPNNGIKFTSTCWVGFETSNKKHSTASDYNDPVTDVSSIKDERLLGQFQEWKDQDFRIQVRKSVLVLVRCTAKLKDEVLFHKLVALTRKHEAILRGNVHRVSAEEKYEHRVDSVEINFQQAKFWLNQRKYREAEESLTALNRKIVELLNDAPSTRVQIMLSRGRKELTNGSFDSPAIFGNMSDTKQISDAESFSSSDGEASGEQNDFFHVEEGHDVGVKLCPRREFPLRSQSHIRAKHGVTCIRRTDSGEDGFIGESDDSNDYDATSDSSNVELAINA